MVKLYGWGVILLTVVGFLLLYIFQKWAGRKVKRESKGQTAGGSSSGLPSKTPSKVVPDDAADASADAKPPAADAELARLEQGSVPAHG